MSNEINNALSNNMAMLTNRITPNKFSNAKQMDPDVFLDNMLAYVTAVNCDEKSSLLFFKMSLEGEASTWLQTLPKEISFDDLCHEFRVRWSTKNKTLSAINELADAKLEKFSDYMCFLDYMVSVGNKGKLPENIIIANILRALPVNIGEKILYNEENLSISRLYSFLGNLKIRKEEEKIDFCNPILNKDKKTERFCIYCSKKGHTANYCFELKKKFKNKKQNVHCIKKEDEENKKFIYVFLFNNKLPVRKYIFNQKIELNVLLDTGCYLNLINSKYVRDSQIKKSKIILKNANSSPIRVLGSVENVSILVEGKEYSPNLIVVEDLCVDAILGFKFLSENKFRLNCSKKFGTKILVKDGNTLASNVEENCIGVVDSKNVKLNTKLILKILVLYLFLNIEWDRYMRKLLILRLKSG